MHGARRNVSAITGTAIRVGARAAGPLVRGRLGRSSREHRRASRPRSDCPRRARHSLCCRIQGMAKVVFTGLDGAEKSFRLQTHRPFTIGRDPGNDIVLRDPKVSRHHSEIVFERGFFVLHDLASANGSFINGRRVRVAPLTHGAQVRMGNTIGKFSEELPTESDAAPKLEAVPPPATIPDDGGGFTSESNLFGSTAPHEKMGSDESKKKD
jgi:FHA domain